MSEVAIKVENLSKVYKLYDNPVDRLKESIHIFRKKYHKDFYALRNISIEIGKGDTVGIIGKNGSGKSTLLKMITGILSPSSGSVNVNGKVSALLELGAGFNPEFTGIENIYLNGTVMGYTKAEIEKKLDDILEFADIGDFIHQQVKTYSSGMFARLAFAVAVNVDPDILIIDEALSVGDSFFQNKCFHKMEDFRSKGKTILFVSHDIGSIKQLCSKAVLLDKGELIDFSDKDVICDKYLDLYFKENNLIVDKNAVGRIKKDHLASDVNTQVSKNLSIPLFKYEGVVSGNGKAEIVSFCITDKNGNIVTNLKSGNEYLFRIIGKFKDNIKNVIFGFILENLKGVQVFASNSYMLKNAISEVDQRHLYEASFKFVVPKIQKGEYLIDLAIASGIQEEHLMLCWYNNCMSVNIENGGYNLALIELDTEINISKYSEKNITFYTK